LSMITSNDASSIGDSVNKITLMLRTGIFFFHDMFAVLAHLARKMGTEKTG
jgi:hypothetical protein